MLAGKGDGVELTFLFATKDATMAASLQRFHQWLQTKLMFPTCGYGVQAAC